MLNSQGNSKECLLNDNLRHVSKLHKIIREALVDCDTIEWQKTKEDLEGPLEVAYLCILRGFSGIVGVL